MNKTILAAIVAGFGLVAPPGLAAGDDPAALAAEAKGLIERFGGTLKEELVAAMKAGGPVNAIGVCNEKAPGIAQTIAAESGWRVGRSSHKLRNPDNAADAFTAAAIADFVAREAAGEKVEDLVATGIVEDGGQRVFHIVKAIPTGEACLNCHGGAEVKPETEAKLTELYPQDMARGFALGQMRGVFTLSKVLD